MADRGLTILGRSATKLADVATQHGIDGRALASQVGIDIDACTDREHRIAYAELLDLWTLVIDRVTVPSIALDVAQAYSPGDYELLGFVAMTCEDLRSALPLVERFMRLWNDAGRWVVREGIAGDTDVDFLVAAEDSRAARASIESGLGELLHCARAATGHVIRPRTVRFAHESPGSDEAFNAFFGVPVVWRDGVSTITFRREDLDLKLTRSDQSLAHYLFDEAEKRLAALPPAGAATLRVRTHVSALLVRGEPSLETVAQRMGITPRALRRQLSEERASFRDIVDDVRMQTALPMVANPNLTFTEIAFLLGFSDPSPFHRAFKRWKGVTPAAYRRAHADGSSD